tara:strand:- start:263 stop:841 length:579 start_codon:yes stop_codon:yes gene_type:complete
MKSQKITPGMLEEIYQQGSWEFEAIITKKQAKLYAQALSRATNPKTTMTFPVMISDGRRSEDVPGGWSAYALHITLTDQNDLDLETYEARKLFEIEAEFDQPTLLSHLRHDFPEVDQAMDFVPDLEVDQNMIFDLADDPVKKEISITFRIEMSRYKNQPEGRVLSDRGIGKALICSPGQAEIEIQTETILKK